MKNIINLKQASLSASNRGESTALEHRKEAVMLISDHSWGDLKP